MAGKEKRRNAAALDGDEQRLRRKQEETALLLRRIKGFVRWVVEEVAAGRSPSIVIHRYRNYCSAADSASPSPCSCSYDAPVGTDVLSLLHKDSQTSRLSSCSEWASSIPVSIEAIKDLVSVAHYILVVEKETVFQRLANDKFCERNRCIVITLHLPVYCLVDSDPYGFDILATYKFGSLI
nr:unnamed protein product [Digitaria exilis]